MFPFNFSFSCALLRCALLCGVLCLVGVAPVGAQVAPTEKAKVKSGAPELGQSIMLFTPSPDNIAIAPCPDPMPRPALNQYVISNGMPTSITLVNGNQELANKIENDSSWSLSGSIGLLPWEKSTTANWFNNWVIRPYHIGQINPGLYTVSGLRFDIYENSAFPSEGATTDSAGWKFPSSNGDFGEQTLTHIVESKSHIAPVALFYPSAGFQHPQGGSPGYSHAQTIGTSHSEQEKVPTANFFYYYEQAWNSPVNIEYWQAPPNDNSESYYAPGDDHVHIAHTSHGAHGTALFEKATSSGSTPFLTWIGWEETYGIDTFARLITHENKHKWLWETYNLSIFLAKEGSVPDVIIDADGNQQANDPDADPDNDNLPTHLEIAIGLNPLQKFTTTLDTAFQNSGYGDDEEVFVRMAESGVFGPRQQDWADDGLNFGRSSLPGCGRTKILDTYKNFIRWSENGT